MLKFSRDANFVVFHDIEFVVGAEIEDNEVILEGMVMGSRPDATL